MSNAQPEAKQIFLEALDRDSPEEILSFIDQACGNDQELRSRVDALLKAHQDVGQFLGGPPPSYSHCQHGDEPTSRQADWSIQTASTDW